MPAEGSDDPGAELHEYVKLLDDNLKTLQAISFDFQSKLIAERTSVLPPEKQTSYQAGDYVMFQQDTTKPLPSKLSPKFLGPYEVIKQVKNDVTCKHLVDHSISIFHVTRLKPFFGTEADAFKIAQLDKDQHLIEKILAYAGDPIKRTAMDFETKFADGQVLWLPYSKDIADTAAFREFCMSRPELFILLLSSSEATKLIAEMSKKPISGARPGDIIYVNLRYFGYPFYNALNLPDMHHKTYLTPFKYGVISGKHKNKIDIICLSNNKTYTVTNFFIKSYGNYNSLADIGDAIVIDRENVHNYSKNSAILKSKKI